MRRHGSLASRRSDDRGALTLSYVVILPFVFVVVMTFIQTSLWFLARNAALAAAQQGVDAARAFDASRAAGPVAALAFARQAGQGYLVEPLASEAGSTSTTISITVSGHVPTFVPDLVLSVSETAQGAVEGFRV